jgi:hypothetical protein
MNIRRQEIGGICESKWKEAVLKAIDEFMNSPVEKPL